MDGKEALKALLEKIDAKVKINSEVVCSLKQLQTWIREIVDPSTTAPLEPGYPKQIAITLPRASPNWVAEGPRVMHRWVYSRTEEEMLKKPQVTEQPKEETV